MSNSNPISLNEAIIKSEYPEYIKDKVKLFVLENHKNYNNVSNLYITKCFNKNIFVIKFDLYVKFKGIEYILTILIYIPVTFPNELRIYFEYNQDFLIDNYYQDLKIIDQYTAELYYEKIINYIPLSQPLTQLINALTDKFLQKFPLFKSKQKPEYYGPCHLEEKNSTKIDIKPDDLKIIEDLAATRKKLKDKILKILEEKVLEIQKTQSQLDNIKTNINNQINNLLSKPSNNELEDMNAKLIELKSKLENDIQKLKYKEKKGVLEKCEEVVEIKNREKYKYSVMKKTIEDYLLYIKKCFERKIINLRQAVDETRKMSKELFYINYLAHKDI